MTAKLKTLARGSVERGSAEVRGEVGLGENMNAAHSEILDRLHHGAETLKTFADHRSGARETPIYLLDQTSEMIAAADHAHQYDENLDPLLARGSARPLLNLDNVRPLALDHHDETTKSLQVPQMITALEGGSGDLRTVVVELRLFPQLGGLARVRQDVVLEDSLRHMILVHHRHLDVITVDETRILVQDQEDALPVVVLNAQLSPLKAEICIHINKTTIESFTLILARIAIATDSGGHLGLVKTLDEVQATIRLTRQLQTTNVSDGFPTIQTTLLLRDAIIHHLPMPVYHLRSKNAKTI